MTLLVFVDKEELGLRQSGQRRRGPFIVDNDGRETRAEKVEILDASGTVLARLVYSTSGPRAYVHAWLEIDGHVRIE